jgi:hypothetical protein
MSNRETYPSSLFPLRGDVSAEAGATTATVIGIQTTPVASTLPTNQQVLVYQLAMTEYVPTTLLNVWINGVGSSFDKKVYINGVTDGAASWSVSINGTPDGG